MDVRDELLYANWLILNDKNAECRHYEAEQWIR
jgi:hypothetical protein